jgi:hypothetical protein
MVVIMRLFFAAVVLYLGLAPAFGLAQGQPPPVTFFKGLTKEDLKSVCVYNDGVYTNGSIICVGKGVALFCGTEKTPLWSIVDKDLPAASACARQ